MSLTSDLAIIMSADNATPNVGDNVTFTITAVNNGVSNDTLVIATDILPSGYLLVSATPSVGSWLAPNWTIGNFITGASATIIIVATVLSTGLYDNTVTITGANFDPVLANNTSTVVVTPIPIPFNSVIINPAPDDSICGSASVVIGGSSGSCFSLFIAGENKWGLVTCQSTS